MQVRSRWDGFGIRYGRLWASESGWPEGGDLQLWATGLGWYSEHKTVSEVTSIPCSGNKGEGREEEINNKFGKKMITEKNRGKENQGKEERRGMDRQ